MPDWALPLSYWLHMLATVAWIGGLVFQSAVLQPALHSALSPAEQPRLLDTLRKRFQPLAWLSLALSLVVLALTAIARTA